MSTSRPRYALFLSLAFGVALALVSCGRQADPVLDVSLDGSPDTLDPHATSGTLTFQALKSVYDTLIEPDQDGQLIGALATSWSISPDGLEWSFTLREGVSFHNGDQLTSSDVQATFNRLLEPERASPNAGDFEAITQILAPDAQTVVFRLSQPFSPLLASLASGWGAILPASLIESGHDFGTEPVGTGPFTLVEWVRDNRIELRRNPTYWMADRPSVERVVIHSIPERAVQVEGLLRGDLDVVMAVDSTDVERVTSSARTRVEQIPTALVQVMAINTQRHPFTDLRVRQALNLAIDKQRVLDVAYGGGHVVGTFMDSGDPYYVDFTDLYPYDPQRARELLEDAGVGQETRIELVLPQIYEAHVRAGQIYQEMLTQVGLNVEIRLVDWSFWLEQVYGQARYDLTVIGHTGKLDPHGRLNGYGTDSMYVRWGRPDVAALIRRASLTTGFEARKQLYDQVLRVMAREVPFVFVGTSNRSLGLRESVTGFRVTPKLDTPDFRWVQMES